MTKKNNEGIITSFWQGFSSGCRKHWNQKNLACELIPYLTLIISPDLKMVRV